MFQLPGEVVMYRTLCAVASILAIVCLVAPVVDAAPGFSAQDVDGPTAFDFDGFVTVLLGGTPTTVPAAAMGRFVADGDGSITDGVRTLVAGGAAILNLYLLVHGESRRDRQREVHRHHGGLSEQRGDLRLRDRGEEEGGIFHVDDGRVDHSRPHQAAAVGPISRQLNYPLVPIRERVVPRSSMPWRGTCLRMPRLQLVGARSACWCPSRFSPSSSASRPNQ